MTKVRSRNSVGSMNGSRRQSVDREQVEAEDTQRNLDLDLVRSELVEPLAAVEEELQCSDAEPGVAKPSQSSRPANGRSARRPRNSRIPSADITPKGTLT